MDGRIKSFIASTGPLRRGFQTTLEHGSLLPLTDKQEGKREEDEQGKVRWGMGWGTGLDFFSEGASGEEKAH